MEKITTLQKICFRRVGSNDVFINWSGIIMTVICIEFFIYNMLVEDLTNTDILKLVLHTIEFCALISIYRIYAVGITCGYLAAIFAFFIKNGFNILYLLDSINYSVFLAYASFIIFKPWSVIYNYMYGENTFFWAFELYLKDIEFFCLEAVGNFFLWFIQNGPLFIYIYSTVIFLFLFFIIRAANIGFLRLDLTLLLSVFSILTGALSIVYLKIFFSRNIYYWANFLLEFYSDISYQYASYIENMDETSKGATGNTLFLIILLSEKIIKLSDYFIKTLYNNELLRNSSTFVWDDSRWTSLGFDKFSQARLNSILQVVCEFNSITLLVQFVFSLACAYICWDIYKIYRMDWNFDSQKGSFIQAFTCIALFSFFGSLMVDSSNFFIFFISWKGIDAIIIMIGKFWLNPIKKKIGIRNFFFIIVNDLILCSAIVLTLLLNYDSFNFTKISLLVATSDFKEFELLNFYFSPKLIGALFIAAFFLKIVQIFYNVYLIVNSTEQRFVKFTAIFLLIGVFLVYNFVLIKFGSIFREITFIFEIIIFSLIVILKFFKKYSLYTVFYSTTPGVFDCLVYYKGEAEVTWELSLTAPIKYKSILSYYCGPQVTYYALRNITILNYKESEPFSLFDRNELFLFHLKKGVDTSSYGIIPSYALNNFLGGSVNFDKSENDILTVEDKLKF